MALRACGACTLTTACVVSILRYLTSESSGASAGRPLRALHGDEAPPLALHNDFEEPPPLGLLWLHREEEEALDSSVTEHVGTSAGRGDTGRECKRIGSGEPAGGAV